MRRFSQLDEIPALRFDASDHISMQFMALVMYFLDGSVVLPKTEGHGWKIVGYCRDVGRMNRKGCFAFLMRRDDGLTVWQHYSDSLEKIDEPIYESSNQ